MTCGCCAPSADISRYESADILAKQKFGNAYLLVENESKTFVLCYKMDEKLGKRIIIPGAHHFNGQYEDIASTIMKEIQKEDE